MFMVSDEDVIAIHRSYELGGRDAALIEARRLWPIFADTVLCDLVDRVLAMSTEPPAPFVGKKQAKRDGPASPRRRSK